MVRIFRIFVGKLNNFEPQFISPQKSKFQCSSEREFPELFKTHLTFIYSAIFVVVREAFKMTLDLMLGGVSGPSPGTRMKHFTLCSMCRIARLLLQIGGFQT